MTVYIIIVIIPLIIWALLKRTPQIALFFMILFLAAIAGGRYEIGGYDYFVYQNAYTEIPDLAHIDGRIFYGGYAMAPYEPMFAFSMSISKLIGLSYNYYLFAFAFIVLFLIGKGIHKLTNDYLFIFLLYVLNSYLWHNFTIIRWAMSFAIILNSFPYIHDKRPWRYLASVLFAASWHVSALIMIFIYPLLRMRLTMLRVLFFVAIGLLLMFFLDNVQSLLGGITNGALPVFFVKLLNYLGGDGPGIGPLQGIECLVLLSITYPLLKEHKNDTYFDYSYKLVFYMLLLVLIFHKYQALSRFYEYFKIGIIILAAVWVKDKNKQIEYVKGFLVISYFSIKYVRYLVLFDNGALIPYRSFLF